MLKHKIINPTHKDSLLIQLRLKPIPEAVVKECTRYDKPPPSDEAYIKYKPYASEENAKLYEDISKIIGADIGISCTEVYEQLGKEHKIPTSARKGVVKMPYNTFVRYFYDAHRLCGVQIPTKTERAYRLVLKGYTDERIAEVSGVSITTARRIKILLGYPGYKGKVYDKDFINSVNNAVKRMGGSLSVKGRRNE